MARGGERRADRCAKLGHAPRTLLPGHGLERPHLPERRLPAQHKPEIRPLRQTAGQVLQGVRPLRPAEVIGQARRQRRQPGRACDDSCRVPAVRRRTADRRRISSRSPGPSSPPRGRRGCVPAAAASDRRRPGRRPRRRWSAQSFCAAAKLGASSPVLEPASTWTRQRLPAASACSTSAVTSASISATARGWPSEPRIGTVGDLDQVGIEPRDRRIGPHRRARWRDTGEVPALRRGEHAAAGFLGRDHDVDERLPRTAAREVQRGVFAIGAGRREHDFDAGQIGRAADVEDAPPDRRHRLCESQVQVAGPGGADQLLPERVRGGVGLGRDGRCGRRAKRQRRDARTWRAAVRVQAGRGVELEPAAAARGQQLLERRGKRAQLLEAIAPRPGATSAPRGRWSPAPERRCSPQRRTASIRTSRSLCLVRWLVRQTRITVRPPSVVVDGAATPDSCRSATRSAFSRSSARARPAPVRAAGSRRC